MTVDRRILAAVVPVTIVVLLVEFIAGAWVSEDAHITFRAVVNFANGDGMRWNIDERVQVFTHPLWMLLVSGLYAITREFYFTVTALSVALSISAYALLTRIWPKRPLWVAAAVFAPLALSTAIVQYATSGFETSLGMFLCAAFACLLFRGGPDGEAPVGRLALIAALAAINRLDTILIYVPVMAVLLVTDRSRWRRVAFGFAPAVAWLLFSLVYFGFPLPNTAYAKLSGAVPREVFLLKGVRYWANLLQHDPVSGLALSAGMVTAVHLWIRLLTDFRSRRLDRGLLDRAAFGAGILLYGVYVVWVGGDFLSGRFWVTPVFASVALCAVQLGRSDLLERIRRPRFAAVTVVALLAYFAAAHAVATAIEQRTSGTILQYGPARVRLNRNLEWKPTPTATVLQMMGWGTRKLAEADPDTAQKHMAIGFLGFTAGQQAIIIDGFALADPLLARLPPIDPIGFKTGHLRREVPAGYLKARGGGSLDEMDPALAAYYAKLRLIVAGPLFDLDRIETLIRFNLGQYDPLLDEYLDRRYVGWGQPAPAREPDHSP